MMNINMIARIGVLVVALFLVTGAGKAQINQPCTANDKLIETMSRMMEKAQGEAIAAKSKYEAALENLKNHPCGKQSVYQF